MSLEKLKNLSPKFNNDKIKPFDKPLMENVKDFTPQSSNDKIKPFNKLLIENVPDFTPYTSNDKIKIPNIPTGGSEGISFIKNAESHSPILENHILGLTNHFIGSLPGGFTKNMEGLTDSQLAIDGKSRRILPPSRMIETFGDITLPSEYAPNFKLNMSTLTDSVLAPNGNVDNMIQPTTMTSIFGEIGTAVDHFKDEPIPDGFSLDMELITDSKLAPGGDITLMVQPTKTTGEFGPLPTHNSDQYEDGDITITNSTYDITYSRLAELSSFSPLENMFTPYGHNDLIGLVDYQNPQYGGFTAGNHPMQLTLGSMWPAGFTQNMDNISKSKLVHLSGVGETDDKGNSLERGTTLPPLQLYDRFGIPSYLAGTVNKDSQYFIEFKDRFANDKTPSGTSWENLYNPDHTSNEEHRIDDRLNIRYEPAGRGLNRRDSRLGGTAGEPYIVSPIPTDNNISGGRLDNFGSRGFPIARSYTDIIRISKFMSSNLGLWWMARTQIPAITSNVTYPYNFEVFEDNSRDWGALGGPQRTSKWFNPLSTLGAIARAYGDGQPNILLDKDVLMPGSLFRYESLAPQGDGANLNNMISFGGSYSRGLFSTSGGFDVISGEIPSAVTGGKKLKGMIKNPVIRSGDVMTLAPIVNTPQTPESTVPVPFKKLGDVLGETPNRSNVAFKMKIQSEEAFESSKLGMPFYFVDLRDNAYIIFRAYISGLTENIAPEWSPTEYIGRSEPVYTYKGSSRDISFTLKLFAFTSDELEAIYRKINRLNTLCYPEYREDEKLNSKVRMKAPLTKFRMGELYGSQKGGSLTGYIKSLNYTYPDNSPWETVKGKRVPKYIEVTIGYQVIHKETPSLRFAQKGSGLGVDFYGINSHDNVQTVYPGYSEAEKSIPQAK